MHPQLPAQAASDVPPLQGIMAHNTPGSVFDVPPLQGVMAYNTPCGAFDVTVTIVYMKI